MNVICKYAAVTCLLLFIASACFAQMYTVTDLTPPGSESEAFAINNRGQVVGYDSSLGGFRTAPNSPMNPATDLLGMGVGGLDINDSGQVVGYIWSGSYSTQLAFSTAPNSLVPVPVGGPGTSAHAINASGQVVVSLYSPGGSKSFRTAPNSPVNPATDDLGTLAPQGYTGASGINNAGQVVGSSGSPRHAYRTAPNKPINPATDDLGTLGGSSSFATSINAFGQVVGVSDMASGFVFPHAFRTAPNRPINPVTDDLGTDAANAINDYGEVVGPVAMGGCFDGECYDNFGHYQPFLYSSETMHDLNKLIPPVGRNCELSDALDINNSGQMAANVVCDLDDGSFVFHAVLLTPVYKALVRPPIKADGSSVFSAKRGVLPVKFKLTKYQAPTCSLPPATIAITRASAGTLVSIKKNMYLPSSLGSRFRIDPNACQYIYDLPTSGLGIGTYRVDISINQVFVGHAVFTLK
jgi:probable HAF family extracellular repeat protein